MALILIKIKMLMSLYIPSRAIGIATCAIMNVFLVVGLFV